MIDTEKGHIFFWQARDFRPVRTFFSLIFAGGILFALITLAPLPFAGAKKAQKDYKTERMVNSQNLKPVIIVSADRLAASGITSHFSYNDPLNSAATVNKLVDQSVSNKSNKILQNYDTQRPPHIIQYAEVPFALPKIQNNKTITPDVPLRDPLPLRGKPSPPVEFRLVAKTTPSASITSPPFSALGGDRQEISYELSVNPSGEVSYALPLSLDFKNKALEEWIDDLKFPAKGKATSYRLSLKMVRK